MKKHILLFLLFQLMTVFAVNAQDSLIVVEQKPIAEIKNDTSQVVIEIIHADTIPTPVDSMETTTRDMQIKNDSTILKDSTKIDSVKIPIVVERKPLIVKISPTDSVANIYKLKFAKLKKEFEHYKYNKADTLANPYYFYIFARPTYFSMPMHEIIGKLSQPVENKEEYEMPPLAPKGSVTPYTLLDGITQALGSAYVNSPYFFTQDEDLQQVKEGIRNDVNKQVKPNINLTEKVNETSKDMVDDFKTDDWNIVVHRPNFWKFKTHVAFKVMQNYVSDNWHKGGESNYSWLAESTLEANYNNKQKVTFDNKLEMRLGFQSSKSDTKHKFKTNADQIRLTNKFGLKATKHWYYTLMLQSWTQFHPSYRKNDAKVFSDFMSPFESMLTLGMDYKLTLKRFNVSATISPFAGTIKYVDRLDLSPSFGLKKGEHTKFDFGSNITMRYNWNIMKNISWNGRVFFFTDYESTRIEWESTFNLRINEYLTTSIYLYPRFDDAVKRKPGQSYFQFHETMSLGVNFNF